MKKNEQSFDSFIIVESDNNSKEKNAPKKINLKSGKKIRNQILEKEEENFEEDEFIELNDEKNKNDIQKDDFICITTYSKEKPKNFESDITLLNTKKNISYKGKILIDENFGVKININNKKELYFNEAFYEFNLLEIKNFNNTQKYSYEETWVEINLKDSRIFILNLLQKEKLKEFLEILDNFSTPIQTSLYFRHAFFEYDKYEKELRDNANISYPKIYKSGWDIYNFYDEFKRQKVDLKNDYEILDNSNFNFCETYPSKIIVPKISQDKIEKCANFRKKKRLPTLTYRYTNGYCIWRSSQTKGGFTGKDDTDAIFLTNITRNSKNLVVYDARPKLNAMANKLKGGGYENPNNYPKINMEVIFCDIPNIHAVRNSYEKLLTNISYIPENDYSVISNLPNTFWYETIILILKGGFQIYNSIKEEKTVLIHCSDGWDRTSQLSALSQILLDKYYRTLKGFIVLIEKDWLSFGHQFRLRNGFCPKEKRDEFSPIFIQWLDCIYQIIEQNCSKFEFNVNLLNYIAERIYSGKYGTFLFNSEKERKENNAKETTISIWNDILEKENEFKNPIYDEKNEQEIQINYKKIKLWKEYFLRFEKRKNDINYINKFINKEQKYINEINKKNKILEEMCRIITKEGINYDILSPEAKDEIKKYLQNSTINISFEEMKPTESVMNITKTQKK